MSMLVNQNENSAPAVRVTTWDVCVLALTVLLAMGLLFFPRGEAGEVCIVTWDGGEITLPLYEPDMRILESGGITLVVSVADGAVRVAESGCPDGVCMAAGEIRHGGEIIVCVPADVVIRIPGESEEDFIVG